MSRKKRASYTEAVEIPGVGPVDVVLLHFLHAGPKRKIKDVVAHFAGQPGCGHSTIERRVRTEDWWKHAKLYDDLIHKEGVAEDVATAASLKEWAPPLPTFRLTSQRRRDSAKVTQPVAPADGEAPGPKEPPTLSERTGKVKRRYKPRREPALEFQADGVRKVPKAQRARVFREAMDKAIDAAAEIYAEEAPAHIDKLIAAFKLAVDGAMAAVMQANNFLVSNRVRLELSGQKLPDGTDEAITIQETDITIDDRQTATRWLAEAFRLIERASTNHVVDNLTRARLEFKKLDTEVKALRMRIEGTLPPEQVEVRFSEMEVQRLERLRQLMKPDAFADLLDAIERDSRSIIAAGGGESSGQDSSTLN